MKTFSIIVPLLCFCLFSHSQVLISGGAKTPPHPSAILEIRSDSLGLLIPKTSTAKRVSIQNPAEGLLIYDNDEKKIFIFNGIKWLPLQAQDTNNLNNNHFHEINEVNGLSDELKKKELRRVQSNSCEIDFSVPKVFGSANAPCNLNLSYLEANAKAGFVQKIYHFSTSEPDMPATWFLSNNGSYIENRLNIIYAEWIDSGRVEYSIYQSSIKLPKVNALNIVEVTEGTISLSWSKILMASNYVLERSVNENFVNSTEIYRGEMQGFKDENLEANTTYYYRVSGTASGMLNSGYKTTFAETKEKEDFSLIQKFPGASAVYSLSKLNSNYSGFAIQVRRSIDNGVKDIGFINGELDENSLIEFAGDGDVFVKIIYDQGGTFNLVQPIDSMQPKITEQGKIIKYYNKPSIRFDATKLNLLSAAGFINPGGKASVFQVVSNWRIGSLLSLNESELNDAMMAYIGAVNGPINNRYRRSTAVVGKKTDLRHNLITNIFDGTNFSVFINKEQQSQPQYNLPLPVTNGLYRLGARTKGASQGTFLWQTSVVYLSDQTTNREQIELLLENLYNQNLGFKTTTYNLPDGSGTQPGKGFTITGITIDHAETALRTDGRVVVWAANHGQNQEPAQNSNLFPDQRASIVKLLLPLSDSGNMQVATKLDELLIWQNPKFISKATLQGIALANDNTLWFTDTRLLYNFTKQGEFIKSYNFQCNGIAFDEINNQLILSNNAGEVIFVDPQSGEKIGEKIAFGFPTDQITYDSKNEIIYGSTGSIALTLWAMKRTGVAVHPPLIDGDRTSAPEGIAIYDKYLLSASDAWYHPKTPLNNYNQLNAIHVYRMY